MIPPVPLFDRALLDARRRRALTGSVAGADFLLRAVADDLIDRLAAVKKRRFDLAVDLGSPTPYLADALVASGLVARVVRLDRLEQALGGEHLGVAGDAELLPFAPASLDLVVSALAFHFVDDLPGALIQARRALKPDGLLLGALLGGDTLTELRQSFAAAEAELTGGAAPRVAPFAELRAVGALLQRAGFALPVIDQDRRIVRYDNALHLMRDLRAMGATNALVERDRRPLRRGVLLRAAEIYQQRFADADGRVRATFDVISLSGWAPDESQPKPLKPGSAKARLADALGAVERPAGEKAGG
jgi:SAM-dependent methyltransferase